MIGATSRLPAVTLDAASRFVAASGFVVDDRGEFAVGVHNATDVHRLTTGGCARVKAEPLHQAP